MSSRKLVFLCLSSGLACLFVFFLTSELSSDGSVELKANLDLPYDVGALAEDEEAAPEIIIFYGQVYEASAIVFALDESGSMGNNSRWSIQSREVLRSINELTDDSEFGVVYYGSRVSPFRELPVSGSSGNKGSAAAFVTARNPQGDTCLFEGLIKALEIVRRSDAKHRAVIVTSDGRPDNCATGDRATAQEVQQLTQKSLQANPGRKVRVHTIWVGAGGDTEAIRFMKNLAAAHGGSFRQVSR